jgi:hypothetical protein
MPGNDIVIRPAKAGDLEQLWPLVENFAFHIDRNTPHSSGLSATSSQE